MISEALSVTVIIVAVISVVLIHAKHILYLFFIEDILPGIFSTIILYEYFVGLPHIIAVLIFFC